MPNTLQGYQPPSMCTSLKTGDHPHHRASDRPVASTHDQKASRSARLCRTLSKATNDIECHTVQRQMRRSSRVRHQLETAVFNAIARPVHRCEPHNSEVVACDIFATPNSLKSRVARNLKSPFGNIRAVPFKLCPHPRPTTVQNCLSLGSRVALKSPQLSARAPPNMYPFPRFRPLEVSRRRPPSVWECLSRPASGNLHILRPNRTLSARLSVWSS
jgi:hypothetical protein